MAESSAVLLYLAKANGALLLLALAYFGLLRRLTFFQLNRAYLVLALLFAAVYPALPVPALLPAKAAPAPVPAVAHAPAAPPAAAAPAAPATDWAALALALYAAGTAGLLARLLLRLLALARLRAHARPAVVAGRAVRLLPAGGSPFSFGGSIYLDPARHPGPELAAVLRHEQVHVRQAHTADVLLAQLALAAAWCNPAAWLLRRALLDNLEYLADAAVLATGLDRRAYQYSLLRLSHAPAGPALVSHFTFPTLKNRVVMMNTPLSSRGQLARYFVAGPLVLAVALGISGARAQGAGPAVPAATGRPVAAPTPAPARAATQPLPAGAAAAGAATPNAHFEAARRPVAGPAVAPAATRQRAVGLGAAPAAATAAAPLAAAPAGTYYRYGQRTPVVYVDGQRYAGDINALNPKDIASINVFKGEAARMRFGDDAAGGVLAVTTIANQHNAEVVAFNKLGSLEPKATAPAATPAGVPYLAPPALAYLTQHYPEARLLGVTAVPGAAGEAPRYQAEVAVGRRPAYVLFDAAGRFLSEAATSYRQ